jgi:hypothetical protein
MLRLHCLHAAFACTTGVAVQRLHDPVSFGAQVPGEHWAYCREAAAASRNTEVRAMFALSEESLRTNPTQQLGGARHG